MTVNDKGESDVMVSIVVPVFNVADYVEDGLESIARQEFEHPYEVIIIDDCSTDGSLGICQNFAQRNHAFSFRIIENSENLGVSAARNRGLNEARGRYFMFVDPDDLLPPNAMSTLYDTAEKYNAEIVKGNNTIFNDSTESEARYNLNQTQIVTGDQILTTFYEHDKVRGHPWGKLFRRDLLGACRFPLGVRMAQDLFYCCEVFSQAKSLVLLDRNIYRYRNRESGSTGRKFESGSYLDWLNSVESTAKFAKNSAHLRAHKKLLVRTMTQLARECRHLPPQQARHVLEVIEQRSEKWDLRLQQLVFRDKLGLRSVSRYLKMRLAIRETWRKIKGLH